MFEQIKEIIWLLWVSTILGKIGIIIIVCALGFGICVAVDNYYKKKL